MRNLGKTLQLVQRRERTVFNGFWHGPPIGPLRYACLASFVAMGHSYELFTYERVAVPTGIRLRDARKVIPKTDLFYWDNPITGKSDISPFSDLFRFKLLSERGGWWSDLDAICLSPDIPSVGRAWAQEKPERSPGAIGSSQIAFDAGDPIVLELYRRCLASCRAGKLWREIGPDLMSDVIRDLGFPPDHVGTADTFYPVRWIEMFKLWLPQFKEEVSGRSQKALFMPIYASFPQYIGLDMGRLPPSGSFLGDICDKYLTHEHSLPRYSADEITVQTRAFLSRHQWAIDELVIVAGQDALRRLGVTKSTLSRPAKRSPSTQLTKIDSRKLEIAPDDVLCVVGVRNEFLRLPYFLEYHRRLGVDRFLCMDNGSDDETRDYLLAQDDCHCFHTEGSHFALNTDPPNWSNAVLNTFCEGHWCVVIDGDELLVYPGSEYVSLPDFCSFLEDDGANAMSASMIDMYADGPARSFSYRQNQPFVEAAPFFDPKPGWLRAAVGVYPSAQMFGGMRERLFWHGPFKKTLPPCLTKVPLVRWQRGMRYLVAQHLINQVDLTLITGALLHFKFLTGFHARTEMEITENSTIEEKGLQERKAYLEVFKRQPNLAFRNSESVRYRDSSQLIDLGWMKSTPAYDQFLSTRRTNKTAQRL